MRHIIAISGKDSAATALVQLARAPSLPYEFIFCDVEMELPETYSWIELVEKTLSIKIVRVGKSLEEVMAQQNMMPSHGRRFCTKYGKVFPIRDFIGNDQAVQYFGIRADESNRAGWFGPSNIKPSYPLIEMGIGIEEVYKILENKQIAPPSFFWQRLYDESTRGIGSAAIDRIQAMKPWSRAALFAWRSRSNCFNCFYQRRYEWVGLLEHHPDLFARAEALESQYGTGPDRPCNVEFSWIQGLPLPELRTRAEAIFASRVRVVRSAIGDMMQGRLFVDEVDPMTVTSCGLYCGK